MPLNEQDKQTIIDALKEIYEIETTIRESMDTLHEKIVSILNDVRD